MTLEELEMLIDGCKSGNRLSQQRLYRQFYALGMSVCIRYARNRTDAEEMVHDGFLKAFNNINALLEPAAIKSWLRRIFVRAAIDYFRKYQLSQPDLEPIEAAYHVGTDNTAPDVFSWEDKLKMVQSLSDAYRIAFNLCIIEGWSTAEVADQLGIAEGTVRANVAKARLKLKLQMEKEIELMRKL